MDSLIVTLTANPAVDLNFTADRLAFDNRAYVLARSEAAGGRGINASCVLHALGAHTLAIATCGGAAGDRFEEFLRDCGFPVELVRIQSEIRTNYSITDRQGLAVKLDEKGPQMDGEEVALLERAVLDKLADASWLLLCGSLPPSVPQTFYRRLIEEARNAGVMTLLDADGTPLLEGLEAHPSLAAPNQVEAERLLNRALVLRRHFHEAALQIQAIGAESVILSVGSRGVVTAHEGRVTEVIPPRTDALCPIGAGDALNAAFVWAIENGKDFIDAVRWGVAAGTASANLPGLGFAKLEQVEQVYEEIEIKPVTVAA